MTESIISKQTIALSGGYNIIHPGHIRLIHAAKHFAQNIVIILNSDAWLKKKGAIFMPWDERKEMLLAIKGVNSVEPVDDSDGTVCEALKRLRPNVFGNGGSIGSRNTPERKLCNELGIVCVWGLGGGESNAYDTTKFQDFIKYLDK